jgi:ferredoxin
VKVFVDSTRCTGHAGCYVVAPMFYCLDEEGFTALGQLRGVPAPNALESAATADAQACPEWAIVVIGEPQRREGNVE